MRAGRGWMVEEGDDKDPQINFNFFLILPRLPRPRDPQEHRDVQVRPRVPFGPEEQGFPGCKMNQFSTW